MSTPEALRVIIQPELLEKMNRALISEEDARRTISYCETTGCKLLDNETGDFVGHRRDGVLTYWVRYQPDGSAYMLKSIYCHRAVLEEDAAL